MKSIRQTIVKNAKKIVIKIGTNVLTNDSGILDRTKIAEFAEQISDLIINQKRSIILVSSGAIGAGMGKLKIVKRPKSLPDIQALAAIGQTILIEAYRGEFNKNNIEIGQILVTKEDFQNKTRYQNISNTLQALLKRNIIPIFNENDTVSTREITFGDNDQLCTLISHATHADLVIIFTSTDGLLDTENNSVRIPYVESIDRKILSKITKAKSSRGSGGMHSKISAIKQIMISGTPVILADGNNKSVLKEIFNLNDTGTFFNASKLKLNSKKKWIAYSAKISGELIIDKGAKTALLNNGSLLASGIKNINGSFEKESIVKIMCDNLEIARGITNYNSEELNIIKGLKSEEFEKYINNPVFKEVIHKDKLVITAE